MALPALGAIEDAGKLTRKAFNALEQSPQHRTGLEEAVEQLVTSLYELETQAHADFSQRIRRPLPAPNPNQVGSWASDLRQNRAALAPLMSLSPPQWIMDAAGQIKAQASEILEAVSRPPPRAPEPESEQDELGEEPMPEQPRPAGSRGLGAIGLPPPGADMASAVAVAAASGGQSVATRKVLGIALQAAAAMGTALMGYGLHKWEKKLRNEGLAVDDDEEPFQVKQRSQKVLDSEIPGTSLSLTAAPDGEWIASVKRGGDVISRVPGRKPHDAAASAIKRALEYEETKRHDVEGAEMIGQIIDVTPKKKKARG